MNTAKARVAIGTPCVKKSRVPTNLEMASLELELHNSVH